MKETLQQAETKMQKTCEVLQSQLASIRAGRANPAVLDKVLVDYYGAPTPIQQLAAVAVAEARILSITPWDATCVKPIVKAIQMSDIGINPTDDGKCVRLVFPPLTEERRREIAKDIKKYGEDGKVALRSVRRDFIEKFKTMQKNSELTEDDLKNAETKMQELTDKYCKKADEAVAAKEKEVLEV